MERTFYFLEGILLSWTFVFASEASFGCQLSMSSTSGQRLHTASIPDFGAVGDGVTMNTKAFRNAIFYLSSFSEMGGATLYVPRGEWLTGSFNLVSHLTLYLEQGAVIVGSKNPSDWPLIDPLPSYGRGRELPGSRHTSLIHGEGLEDVVITGENGTIDGQGAVWWKWSQTGLLNYTRGHLVEFISSIDIVISNITLLNSPFWNIHPVYCDNVLINGVTILAPQDSPNTDGIDPDSSSNVCIQDCYIANGDDMVAIKSGWDEYGIAFGKPSCNIHIQRVRGQTKRGAGVAIGSETSGGIQNVVVEDVATVDTKSGISIRTGIGRGAYIRDVVIFNARFTNVRTAITITGGSGEHADENYNKTAVPIVERITVRDVTGNTLDRPGRVLGFSQFPFRNVCFSNISLTVSAGLSTWNCNNVLGFSSNVSPALCSNLMAAGACLASDCLVSDPH